MLICPQLYTFIRFLVIRIIKTLILAGILSPWSYFLLDGSLPQLTLLPVAHKDFSLINRFRKWGGGAKSFRIYSPREGNYLRENHYKFSGESNSGEEGFLPMAKDAQLNLEVKVTGFAGVCPYTLTSFLHVSIPSSGWLYMMIYKVANHCILSFSWWLNLTLCSLLKKKNADIHTPTHTYPSSPKC